MSEAFILFLLIVGWDIFRDFVLINYSEDIKKFLKRNLRHD